MSVQEAKAVAGSATDAEKSRPADDRPIPSRPISSVGSPWQWIPGDLRAKARWLYGGDNAKQLLKALLTDGTLAMILYRCMQQANRWHLAPLAMIFNKLNVIFGRCVIGRGADFGPEFVLIHSLGVVINGSVRGGARVMIEHQVTIGAERGDSPTIGSDVFIGAGAKIIGPLQVGDHAKVGANAVVLHDVPTWSTVAGIPAVVVRQRIPPVDQSC